MIYLTPFLVVNNAFGHKIPPAVKDGLCYLDMRALTDAELTQLSRVLITSDDPWDPHSLDSEPDYLYLFNAEMDDDIEEDWVECSDDYGEVFDEHELLEITTQWFGASERLPMHCHYKTRFPVANVSC